MKKIFTFCFFIIYTCSFAQTEILKTIYEDSLGETASNDNFYIKKEYSFHGKDYIFKISNFKKSILEKDIFTDDTTNIYLKAKVISYHKNGVIAEISHYEKNSIVNEVNTWYDNGQSKEIFKFLEDQKTKSKIKLISQFWDKDNNHLVINGNGEYKNIDPENNIYEVGKVQNYRKSGIWELKSKQYSIQENYEEGKLIFGKAVYTDGETYEYKEIEIRPKPKKGFEHFYQYVGKKLKVRGDWYGKMMIQFVVDKNGELIDLKIKKGISPELDASAIEILKEYGKWIPGKYRGKAVKVQYLLPITIKQVKSMLTIIAAASENNALGKDNQLVWHLPDDFKRFKNLTSGHYIVMGRKTFESFPKPLPNRTHIIITRQKDYEIPEGCFVASSLQKAIDLCPKNEEVFIIGGGEIYNQSIEIANKIDLTRVHTTIEADTFFPEIDMDKWELVFEEFHSKDEKHDYDFTFLTYIRK